MSFLKEMFGTEKPILGLLHLKPLPGDPFYAPHGSLDDVIACARADLDALQSGGVDGVLVTNELSIPYEKKVSGVTLGAMGMVVGALKEHFTVPYGVEAIYDGDATMEICAATGAAFTRCLFTGAWAGDLGLVDRDVAKTLRLKAALRLDELKMFYFVTSEGEVYLNDRSYPDIARSMLFNCRPDALVVGGAAAGVGPGGELLWPRACRWCAARAAKKRQWPKFCKTAMAPLWALPLKKTVCLKTVWTHSASKRLWTR